MMRKPEKRKKFDTVPGKNKHKQFRLSVLKLDSCELDSCDIKENDETILSNLSTGTLKYPESSVRYNFNASSLKDLGAVGNGNFGVVCKMLHLETERLIAVKKIRYCNLTEIGQQRLLREHDTIVNSENSPNIVMYYGAIFHEADFWICMELMDVSIDLLYKRVYNVKHSRLEENAVGHIAVSTIDALSYLKDVLKIIHRDVKPSNILVNDRGDVKLCDFGICGVLEDSVAKTHGVGCQPYLAPERIVNKSSKYDVRSDVWSLGITLYELATGVFPYQKWKTQFDQMAEVLDNDPPCLQSVEEYNFSLSIVQFIGTCLSKDVKNRPKYRDLKKYDFYEKHANGGPAIEQAREVLGKEAIDTRNHPVEIRG